MEELLVVSFTGVSLLLIEDVRSDQGSDSCVVVETSGVAAVVTAATTGLVAVVASELLEEAISLTVGVIDTMDEVVVAPSTIKVVEVRDHSNHVVSLLYWRLGSRLSGTLSGRACASENEATKIATVLKCILARFYVSLNSFCVRVKRPVKVSALSVYLFCGGVNRPGKRV